MFCEQVVSEEESLKKTTEPAPKYSVLYFSTYDGRSEGGEEYRTYNKKKKG
jgi:hypothetical protein